MSTLSQFDQIWVLDVEVIRQAPRASRARCLVAREIRTGRCLRLSTQELIFAPPFVVDEGTLCVAYAATTELVSFEALGWPRPRHLIDLRAEYLLHVNGERGADDSLQSALAHFGCRPCCLTLKDDRSEALGLSELAGRDVGFLVLEYGDQHVADVSALFEVMRDRIDLRGALIRGRSVDDASRIELLGVPFDEVLYAKFEASREDIIDEVITGADPLGVFAGGHLNRALLAEKLEERFPVCPRTETGRVSTKDRALKELGRTDPELNDLRAVARKVNRLRHPFKPIIEGGRSVTPQVPFGARTGRFTPSTKEFVFSAPEWMRGFIKPPKGRAVAYLDWKAQEMGIAAALSGDVNLLEAYASDDFYLGVARLAGERVDGLSADARRSIRDIYKVAAIAMLYGMGPHALAQGTGLSLAAAKALLDKHHEMFPRFWAWADRRVNHALLKRSMTSALGWTIHLPSDCEFRETQALSSCKRPVTLRTLRNFLMQANAADMTRLACRFAHDGHVAVCASVHDGVLIEAPSAELEQAVIAMADAMDRASRVILAGFTLKTTVEARVHYPNHYAPKSPDGQIMWEFVRSRLEAR